MYHVYAIRNIKNNKSYIGTSSEVDIRFRRHFNDLKNKRHFNRLLQEDFNKGNVKIENIVLFEFDNEEDSYYYESMFIKLFKTNDEKYGYNLTIGGKGTIGYSFTEKDIRHMKNREYKIGYDNHMFGYTHSVESKSKISKSMSGINNPSFGRKKSQKEKELISKGMKNKNQEHLIPLFKKILKLREEKYTYDYIIKELSTSRYMISKAIKYRNNLK